jgi:hypothetical protein
LAPCRIYAIIRLLDKIQTSVLYDEVRRIIRSWAASRSSEMKPKCWLLTSLLLVVLLSSCTSLSQPPLSEEEALIQEILQSDGQFTADGRNCGKILETEPWCSVVLTVTNVTRPEWTSLFPATKFFLVKRNVLGQETGFQSNWLIAKQNKQQFTVETFDQTLTANGIVITDTNREEIAKAFVLMSLPNYLEDEIGFSSWGKDDRRSIIRVNYNYTLTSWTKIQGLRLRWLFIFYEDKFIAAAVDLPEYHVGEYIDVPSEILRPPSQESLEYWRKQ